ncbi:MAG: preprotein translocase subunit SecY [Myxococcota bacterium]
MSVFANIAKIPELRRRILFTLGMLAVYRVGIYVTTPGVNRNVLQETMRAQSGGFLGMFNLFSGGALEQMSIFALNIMPYVTASIILSLLGVVVKPLEELRKEGEAGQRKINQYTRYGTIILSIIQGMGIAYWLEGLSGQAAGGGLGGTIGEVVRDPGWTFRFMTVLSLTTGTAFLMWLGEQITERGIGNGISLIIFAGIVANLPDALFSTFSLLQADQIQPTDLLIITFIAVLTTAIICFFERAQRRLPITYSKRTRAGGGVATVAQQSHLPLRVNMAGVIPPIFTSSLLMFPMTLANLGIPGMNWVNSQLQPNGPNQWIYMTVFAILTIFFCFFYTGVQFQPVEVAENLKKQSAYIPNVTPGRDTADYIDRVLTRITVAGSMYITLVCTVPTLLQSGFQVPFYLGGTSLMIVVGVALDTAQQVESHLITRHYEGLASSGPKIRGRR